jgi:acetoin utilization protein AcuB
MLVEKRMRKNLETITPDERLTSAQVKMWGGGFRRLPVVREGKLVGIITDRDLREHMGVLERANVGAVMTESLVTVSPQTTLEEAAKLMLKNKISGLPVIDTGKLVGIITTSHIFAGIPRHYGRFRRGLFSYRLPSGRRPRSQPCLEDDRRGGRRGSWCGDIQGELGRESGVLLAPAGYGS